MGDGIFATQKSSSFLSSAWLIGVGFVLMLVTSGPTHSGAATTELTSSSPKICKNQTYALCAVAECFISQADPCRLLTEAIWCRIFTLALPVHRAASVRDFCSGDYTLRVSRRQRAGASAMAILQILTASHRMSERWEF